MKSLSNQLLALLILGALPAFGDKSPFEPVDLTEVQVREATVAKIEHDQVKLHGLVEGVLLIKWKHDSDAAGLVSVQASFAGAVKHSHDGRRVSGFLVEFYNKYGMRLWREHVNLNSRNSSGIGVDTPIAISDSAHISPKAGPAALLEFTSVKLPPDWTQAQYVAVEASLVPEKGDPQAAVQRVPGRPAVQPVPPRANEKRRRVVLPPRNR